MERTSATKRPSTSFGMFVTAAWIAAFFAARAMLGIAGLSSAMRVGAALLPVAPFAFFLWYLVRTLARLDELERRIHLEALVLAFPSTLLLLMTLGLLQLAVELPADDLSYRHVWPIPILFYFVGLAVARRRYQ